VLAKRIAPVVLVAAVVLVVFLGVRDDARSDGARATETATSSRSGPTVVAPSAWALSLADQLDCDGPPQEIGGDPGELAPVGATGTASPYPWLERANDVDLPLSGWIEEPKVPWEFGRAGHVRYIHVVSGQTKAVLIMAGRSTQGGPGHWNVVGFRACQPAEFDPLAGRTTDDAPWVDANDTPTTLVRSTGGPGHCGWQSTVWLFLDEGRRLYLRDPAGTLRHHWVADYLGSTELPDDARDSGFHSLERRLFVTDDPDAVFIQTPTVVERWPRSRDPFLGCA
jgi:hypothetical protein